MFTPKQFSALHHYANNLRLRNSVTRESVATIQKIEAIGSHLFCSILVEDVFALNNPGRAGFETFAVIAIGPRGGVKVRSIRRDCI